MIDKALLYKDGVCKLCDLSGQKHTEGCPGTFIDNLEVAITYRGANCSRGCCGYSRGTATAPTLEAAIEAVARDSREADHVSCTAFYQSEFYVANLSNRVHVTKIRQVGEEIAAERSQEDLEEKESERLRKIQDGKRLHEELEAMKEDLNPVAYARRLAELDSEYPPEETPK